LTTDAKKKPVAKFGPYGGGPGSSIECSVWLNEGKGENAGKFFYGISLSRSYRKGTDSGGKAIWEDSKGSHSLQDIPVLIHALQKAQGFILEQRVKDKAERRNAEPDEDADGNDF
jgi:hypothetical protein